MTIETASFPNIELVRVGTWNGRTGSTTITTEDLSDAVAAYRDRELDRGKIKFGHTSTLNGGDDKLGDGAPSYGWLENLKLSEDGKALIGDLVDVPKKLAGLIGRAYKQRSVELRRNVTTPSGKTYRAALTGLALLGASAPAVKGMDDIAALYASENPDGIDDEATQESIVSVELSGDDDALIPASHGARGDTEGNTPGTAREDTQEETNVSYPKSTLDALGLPEDATEEQVNAAIAARAEAPEQPEDPKDPEPQPEAEKVEEPAALSAPDTVQVSRAVWDEVQSDLKALKADASKRRRAEVIDAALSEGRIVPAEREKWETALSAAPEATETLLSQLPARVNVHESGSDVALSAKDMDGDELDAYLDRLGL